MTCARAGSLKKDFSHCETNDKTRSRDICQNHVLWKTKCLVDGFGETGFDPLVGSQVVMTGLCGANIIAFELICLV